MTKLEEKLIELGYKKDFEYYWEKAKWVNNSFIVYQINKKLKGRLVDCSISSQQHIDDLQLAFNEMQKDLEILKECEENEN